VATAVHKDEIAMQQWTRQWSYAWCERLARRAAGNFYHAFRILPGEQRRAMCALYSFFRVADDLGDDDQPVEVKRVALTGWREALRACLEGDYRHPLFPALHDAVVRHAIPQQHLEEVLDGVGMDLEVAAYDTFAQLYRYCYHVASAVGLCCVSVWGCRGAEGHPAAEAAGIALQLTNILRDVGEDAARGRVYLPREDLERFGCPVENLVCGVCDEPFRRVMLFQTERARCYYDAALPLVRYLEPPGRAVFLVILRTYRGLLEAIAARNFDVFAGRVRVGSWYKLWLAARALPVRWGIL
jgi:phytoene synthase